jgi:membrane protein YqaA with SNARE-associated domain
VQYLLLVLLVFGINLLPAFGPPTWAVLVFAKLHWHLNPVALVLLGGFAAMSGRYLLARGAHRFKKYLPGRYVTNLEGAEELLKRKKNGVIAVVALFVVSPLPSAQLFIAAGLIDLPLGLLTIAFFLGRMVSYSFYVGVATLADKQFGGILHKAFGSPWSIALQVGLLIAVCLLPLINWKKLFDHTEPSDDADQSGLDH